MKRHAFLLAAALGASAAGIIGQSASAAVPSPTIPGDFVIDIIPPGAPDPTAPPTPDCDPSFESIGASLLGGATSAVTTCKVDSSGSQKTATGTAANPGLATSTGDAGFNKGTLTLLCDFEQEVDLQMEVTRSGTSVSTNLKTFTGVVLQACSFTMSFTDAKASTLSGTVEVNGKLGSTDGTVTGKVIAMSINAKVFVTGGTGQFDGYVGGGTFTQAQDITIPDAPNRGGSTTPTSPTGANPELQAFCSSNSITDCTPTGISKWCQENPSMIQSCLALQSRVTGKSVRTMSSRVSAFAAESSMKLELVKKPGAVRIITPAPEAGSATAPAKVKSNTKVRIAATKGAVCTVKANTGKVVGKATSKGNAVSIRPAANAYKDAKTIQATCQTKAGKFTSNKVKIKLS
jgi:hypothetical protein